MSVHLAKKTPIALLLAKKITVLEKYFDFVDVFSAVERLKRADIDEHTINLEPGRQSLYKPIYSSKPVELKILKTYIKTNLTNRFI